MSTKVDRRRSRDHQRENFSWKVFLRPGWIIMILVIIAFSYAAFSLLAPWQLNKDDQIVARNSQIEHSFEVAPIPYGEVFNDRGAVPAENEWTRVTMTGRYLPESEALLRLRPVEKTPVFQALTPFETDTGDIYLVNRGFVGFPGPDMPYIEPAPGAETTITGHARVNETRPEKQPMTEEERLQVYGINTDQIGEATGTDLADSYIQLSAGAPGELNAMPVPQLDRGSHLSYGFQWIAFGVMAPLGLGYFIWAEIRERRRVRKEEAEIGIGESTGDDATATTAAAPERSRDVRARYGGQHPDHWGRRSSKPKQRF